MPEAVLESHDSQPSHPLLSHPARYLARDVASQGRQYGGLRGDAIRAGHVLRDHVSWARGGKESRA